MPQANLLNGAVAPDFMNSLFRAASRPQPPPAAPPLSAAQLHKRHLDEVYGYVARRLQRREDAEDVTAETFAAAFAALPKYRGDVEPKLWLFGIARRKIADALRRKQRRPETPWDESDEPPTPRDDDPAHHFSRGENARQMRILLAQLQPDQREALLLKYVEELSVEQIAVVMNRSKGAANSLLQRARQSAFARGQSYFLGDSEETDRPRNQDNFGEVKL